MMSVTCLLEDIGVSMYLLWDITKGNSLIILCIWSPTVICIISKFSYLTQLTLIPEKEGGWGVKDGFDSRGVGSFSFGFLFSVYI